MSLFDIFVVTIVVISGIAGVRKGLITGLAKFIGKIVAVFVAFLFFARFLEFLEKHIALREIIEPKVGNLVIKIFEGKVNGGGYGNSSFLMSAAIEQATNSFTNYILNIIAILVLFVAVSLFINLVISFLISPLAKNLTIINRGGGFVLGLLSSFVVLCLVVGLISPFLTASEKLSSVQTSVLYPYLMEGYNTALPVISGFSSEILLNPLESIESLKDSFL
jgi:uncharacterized membrane protein required for colicin V production